MNIFELDDGNTALNKITPNQIGELKIKTMANKYIYFGSGENDYYKIRKYEISNGIIYNADITTMENASAVNVKSLRIVGGVLTIKKQKDVNVRIYESFYLKVHNDDVKLLRNPSDDLVYIIMNPASENSLYIFNSNNLFT